MLIRTPQTQDLNWTYIRHSEDVQDVFWTSYVRSIYVLFLGGSVWINLTLKRLRGVKMIPPLEDFSENVSTKDRVKPCFSVNFNIIISHISFHWNSSSRSEDVKTLSVNNIFINFHRIFGFFHFSLLLRN